MQLIKYASHARVMECLLLTENSVAIPIKLIEASEQNLKYWNDRFHVWT